MGGFRLFLCLEILMGVAPWEGVRFEMGCLGLVSGDYDCSGLAISQFYVAGYPTGTSSTRMIVESRFLFW